MKFVNFYAEDQVRLGIQTEAGIIDVKKAAAEHGTQVPTTIEDVIAGQQQSLRQLEQLLEQHPPALPEEDIRYAPAITHPEKIVCVGLNYAPHVDEAKLEIPKQPVLFSKFNNALAAHQQNIPLPGTDEKIDYEAELVLIIGKEASNVSEEDALSHVFGYTVGNDLSARDLQFLSGQWLIGKSPDNFAPVGPTVVTADEIDPHNLDIELKVNGEIRQSANTKDLIFDCSTIISYVSKHMTLKPGDIIFTGTPEGVILGYPEDQRVWLKSGDVVQVSIEKLGTLTNTLVEQISENTEPVQEVGHAL